MNYFQHWYYVPNYSKDDAQPKPDKGKGKAREESDDDNEDSEDEKYRNSEASRRLETDENLSRAYKYGADLLPISKEDEQDFYRFPAGESGMLIRGFRPAAKVGLQAWSSRKSRLNIADSSTLNGRWVTHIGYSEETTTDRKSISRLYCGQ